MDVTPAYLLRRCAPHEAEASEGLLSAREQAAASLLRVPKRRKDWLAGRIATKKAVLQFLAERGRSLQPEQVEVLNDADGAPYVRLPEGESPRVSISHSASGGLAAVARDGRLIGVDVETACLRPSSFLSMMAHESELTPEIRDEAAAQTRLWTIKEAVSKLLGVGLSVDLWDIRHVGGTLELHGKALARWREMGAPKIEIESFEETFGIVSVAYTGSTEEGHA